MPQLTTDNLLVELLNGLPDAVTFMLPVYESNEPADDDLPVDFSFVYSNDKASAYSGLPKEVLVGKTIFSTGPISTASRDLFQQLLQVYTTGTSIEFRYLNPVSNTHLDVYRSKFRNGILSISRDRSAQQRAEQELLNKNQLLEDSIAQLQQSNENLERYAYVASHDLQEPLRKIITYSEMLERRYKDQLAEDGQKMVEKMKDAAWRMDRLIRDLLNYSKLSGNRDLFEDIDINDVVKEVIADLETPLSKLEATVRFDNLRPVHGSKFQMRQLFQNLISNSLKFVNPGVKPEIQIKSSITSGRNSGIEIAKEDWDVSFQQISMTDNGIGFDQANADQIFQIFKRLHGKAYPGSGIGLSIVKKVIEQHRGYISAKGEPGKGATFIILLPLTD